MGAPLEDMIYFSQKLEGSGGFRLLGEIGVERKSELTTTNNNSNLSGSGEEIRCGE